MIKIKIGGKVFTYPREQGPHNRIGQAYALTILTPIIPGHEVALRDYLESLPGRNQSPFITMGKTHFARFVIIDQLFHQGAPQERDELHSHYLLFESNLDGDLDAYLEDIRQLRATEADAIWGACVGYPGSGSRERFHAYLRHNLIDTIFFVPAYPDAPVQKVLEALGLRQSLIDFAINSQDMDADTLQQTFRDTFNRRDTDTHAT